MHTWYLISVWLHILAAAIWIGGMVFLAVVLVPALRAPEISSVRVSLLYQTGLRFRRVGWVVFGVLIATGIVNVGMRGFGWNEVLQTRFWTGGWGGVLGIKLLLVVLLLAMSAVHDFYVGPRATRLMQDASSVQDAAAVRRVASIAGRLILLLSLAILALAVMLVRGW
ncbi:MAG TPA: DUF4149 domain-containing protein [Rhodothermales bacterium]